MFTQPSPRRLLAGACALAIAIALSACGGSGSDNGSATPAPPPVGTMPPPGAANDSFFAIVYAKAMQMLDNEEPAALDQVTETKPENTEPESVPAG